jgi:hypothetical protein
MRRALILVMAAGCRQLFGLESPDVRDAGPDDVIVDVPRDAQGGSCFERWQQGPQFSAVLPLMGVNSSTNDRAPFVTADGTRLYYVHDNDFYSAPKVGNAFGSPAVEMVLTSGSNDNKIYVSANQLRAFMSSNRNGGAGGTDLWRATRASETDAWTLDQMFLEALNAAGDQSDPFLSEDLLRMYFAPRTAFGQHIAYAERPTAADSFKPPSNIAELMSQLASDDQPALSGDERLIVFTSNRNGSRDLWYSTRADRSMPFTAPKPVDGVNLPARNDEAAYVTPDACTLYFASDRGMSMDLYMTTLLD